MTRDHLHKKGEICGTCTMDRSGLRVTKHRQLLFENLKMQKQPVSAETLFYQLKNNDVDMNLSTVYRILEHFVQKGIVRKTQLLDEGKALFELTQREHIHYLICTVCKKIVTIEGCPLKNYESLLSARYGYEITSHKLEVYGVCPECKG